MLALVSGACSRGWGGGQQLASLLRSSNYILAVTHMLIHHDYLLQVTLQFGVCQ